MHKCFPTRKGTITKKHGISRRTLDSFFEAFMAFPTRYKFLNQMQMDLTYLLQD